MDILEVMRVDKTLYYLLLSEVRNNHENICRHTGRDAGKDL